MKVVYSTHAKEDKIFWEKTNTKIAKRIDKLIADIILHPFTGLGKPEPLKFQMSGYWSRRIDNEHRLIYKIANKSVYVVQCRYHY